MGDSQRLISYPCPPRRILPLLKPFFFSFLLLFYSAAVLTAQMHFFSLIFFFFFFLLSPPPFVVSWLAWITFSLGISLGQTSTYGQMVLFNMFDAHPHGCKAVTNIGFLCFSCLWCFFFLSLFPFLGGILATSLTM